MKFTKTNIGKLLTGLFRRCSRKPSNPVTNMNSMMKIDDAIALLNSYSGPFKLILHPAASEALIHAVEQAYDIRLPEDFKSFYRFTNGFEIDEDIFNMIPLDEMISNSKDDQRPAIAEFMIYSDLWYLEIDDTDADQYQIYVISHDAEKIILTNSLADFILSALNGSVCEPGGLYEWQKETKAGKQQ